MPALGWLLNLDFAASVSDEVVIPPVVDDTQPTGGWPEYGSYGNYRRRKLRNVLPEEEQEAVEVVERVVEAIAPDKPKKDDVELALRLALQQQDILYRAIYLKMALDELEELEKERKRQAMMIEEENAIILFAVMN